MPRYWIYQPYWWSVVSVAFCSCLLALGLTGFHAGWAAFFGGLCLTTIFNIAYAIRDMREHVETLRGILGEKHTK
ncbi:hypothetical protein DYB13_08595 [Vibrio cholerae]|nr:hypothetical protein [Vibrio cholerae]KFD84588.1 putative membrane protein [Vibrio cholerae]GHZ61390.1 hypothetical protein VCSRO80_2608 [Vibrio cholerae]